MVKDALYDWFVDTRGSVQGSIGRAFVRVWAQQLASQVIRAMAAKKVLGKLFISLKISVCISHVIKMFAH